MKTQHKLNSYPRDDQLIPRLHQALDQDTVEQLARQTRFQRRTAKKLTPYLFLLSCFGLVVADHVSYRTWAMVIGLIGNLTYSKQALFKRFTAAALAFVQGVLQVFLVRSSLGVHRVLPPGLEDFNRVIIQDSVILTLAPKLARFFPGSRNQSGKQAAQIRVQAFLDLKHEEYIHFSHTAYTANDLAGAGEALAYLRAGDLFIRDLGYFVLAVLRQLLDKGVKLLSRLKLNAQVFDLEGQPLDLAKVLRHQERLDQEVLLGAKEKLRVRLVALPVPEVEANRRRRLARQNRRFHPSKKHLFLLGWNLYITNVSARVWSAKTVGLVYGLRWRVEVTFKAWKQHFHCEDIPAGSRTQVEVLLYARLLLISLFEVNYLAWWDYRLQRQPRPPMSLLKLAEAIRICIFTDVIAKSQPKLSAALAKQIAYHCTYEKRKRPHFIDMLALG